MTIREILQHSMLNAPTLASLSGVKVGTIRAIMKSPRAKSARSRIYPSTRAKLAAALRAHSAELARLADQLDPA